MTDYEYIEAHIRQARLQRSAHLGELIGNGLAAGWIAARDWISGSGKSKVKSLTQLPRVYSTAMPRRF